MFRPSSAGDRYLSGLRAGDYGLPLRRRVHSRVGMVAFGSGGRRRLEYS